MDWSCLVVVDNLESILPAPGEAVSAGTTEVLELLAPRFYAKGVDWEGRLPQEEVDTCARNGTQIVFLDTVLGSSTAILERYERERRGD